MALNRNKLANSMIQRLTGEFLGDLGDASGKMEYLLREMLLEEIDDFDIISIEPKAKKPVND